VRDAGDGECSWREGAVAGLAVAGDGLHQEAEQRARRPVGKRAVPAHAVALPEEPRAEHVVRPATSDRREDALEVARVVLAIAVEVDGGGIALVARDLEPGAKGSAEAARELVRVDSRTIFAGDLRGAIARAVVDEEHVDRQPARPARKPGEHIPDSVLLIPGNDNGKAPRTGRKRSRGNPSQTRFSGECPA
jgi:hypothetical protein